MRKRSKVKKRNQSRNKWIDGRLTSPTREEKRAFNVGFNMGWRERKKDRDRLEKKGVK